MYLRRVPSLALALLVSWAGMSCPLSLGVPQGNLANVNTSASAPLASPSVAQLYADMAYELFSNPDASAGQLDCAMVFLRAAGHLDRDNNEIHRMLVDLAERWPERNYSSPVFAWLDRRDAQFDDVGLVKDTIAYLVRHLRSSAEREQFLQTTLMHLRGRDALLDSYLNTELGLLMVKQNKKTDARRHLQEAYRIHLYNKRAFAELAELLPDQITPEMYFEHLRFVMLENPLDIDAALDFAQYAERLELYSLAAGAYDYCAELYYYLYPDQSLPAYIYMPWAISNYNVKAQRHKVTQIASKVRNSGEFNLFLEAYAGRAAHLLGDESTAQSVFAAAEQKATQLHFQGPDGAPPSESSPGDTQVVGPKQFAWFYCFVLPNKEKALEWANLAYSTEPNSEASASLLAYALVLNEQWQWAKLSAEKHDRQIALLALALIQLQEGRKDSALKSLNRAIGKDPGSLVAERARDILVRQGSRYRTPVNAHEVLTNLAERFGELIVPRFTLPEKLVTLRFDIPKKVLTYGQPMNGIVTLANPSDEPLLLSDSSLFRGVIQIDARSQGDLTGAWPGLIVRKLFDNKLIEPGKSISRSVRLDVGGLGRALHTHPQAGLSIDFTLYLDPVATDPNTVKNRVASIQPIVVRARRSKVEISRELLNQQYNAIALGNLTQRAQVAELFTGLLTEIQEVARNGAALYEIKYADWMPGRLRSALTSDAGLLLAPTPDGWELKTQVLGLMRDLEFDNDLTLILAQHMNSHHWPVRLLAMYLLAGAQGPRFDDVLEHQIKYDSNRLVRDMAQVLKQDPGRLILSSVR